MLFIQSVRQDTSMQWFEEFQEGMPTWLLVMVNYGKCLFWIRQEKVLLEKGDLLLIPSHTSFYGKSIPSVTHEKYMVSFQVEEGTLMQLLPLLTESRVYKWRTVKYELLLHKFRTMLEEWTERPAFAEAMCGALAMEVLALWSREMSDGHPSTTKEKHTELMKAYIQNHYREKVTKEELGAVIGKSPNYAASVFSEVTGQTIGGFVHALRIKTAVYLLIHSQRTVGDISDYLGYCDPSYFHRIFKRETGQPPAAYVKYREQPSL
ncbi:helix-turn-helix domain-containing protein [Paenibacillus radicis (ex Xue et al. 2023)]|uniref:AraC family transcriptional regulator n=1 Tax=Paenibacillus radicis (ex Xue et al. 2023) TaxID=2972489 RepID=A0ABT1Y953_9BACL|nr:AraC family transcriptional regulator [Paenibacillus radicis (ex Xue et al. 2023)]MCR8629725.1 AraC family transcriptional regulator [Paenibacillus radicis (ex Xue et al. 2023)]